MFGQSKIGSSSHIIFIYTLFRLTGCEKLLLHLFLLSQPATVQLFMLSQNHFPEPNQPSLF
jgi:hypothetical protein